VATFLASDGLDPALKAISFCSVGTVWSK